MLDLFLLFTESFSKRFTEIRKYDVVCPDLSMIELWTETYLDYLAERVSTNIYNALCVEILDPLQENLKNTFTVELLEHSDKDKLLEERPGFVQINLVSSYSCCHETQRVRGSSNCNGKCSTSVG